MPEILIAFVTGLTTGGLSCLAVQGGLLANSLAYQLEDSISKSYGSKNKKHDRQPTHQGRPQFAKPIILFLGAKLISYTILGLLLGWLGSALTLNIVTRALLLIAIGIFMIGNGLRMLNIHPLFRYFVITPPSFVTRTLRRLSKKNEGTATPIILGALTVLIPCGVTQAMMAVAVGTGDPLSGAAIMFAFTLGASPIFFLIAYLATQVGARMEKYFNRFVILVMVILGFVSINNGLTLIGSPLAMTNLFSSQANEPVSVPLDSNENSMVLNAYNNGYSPQILHAQAGKPINLNVVTDDTYSCVRAFVIPSLDIEALLPETGQVPIVIPPQEKGTEILFTCSMGMYSGKIVVDQ
jgi:sulfite exporter TauE/SafE